MARWQSLEDDDDFFGDAGDSETKLRRCEDGNEMDVGLARAEASAIEERFRNIGYHETYDSTKEARLQEGFEAGYHDAFEVSQRIGQMLGRATVHSKKASSADTVPVQRQSPSSAQDHDYFVAARHVRDFLTKQKDDSEKDVSLEEIEANVKLLLQRNV